jgi:predicted outer membrane protein
MNRLNSRIIAGLMISAVLIVPLYAHHGTQFLSKVTEMNTAEVRLGEMATNKAENPRVKEYAQMLVRDHNAALNKVRQLQDARMADSKPAAGQNQNSNKAEVKLTPQHQRTMDKLNSLSGAAFDRDYINHMVTSHREGIRLFEAQARVHGNGNAAGKKQTSTQNDSEHATTREKPTADAYSRSDLARDMDTADFARETLPTLKKHLEQALSIQMELQRR